MKINLETISQAEDLENQIQKLLKYNKEQLARIIIAMDAEREMEIERRIGSIKKKYLSYRQKMIEYQKAVDNKNELIKLLEEKPTNVHLGEIIVKRNNEIRKLRAKLDNRIYRHDGRRHGTRRSMY